MTEQARDALERIEDGDYAPASVVWSDDNQANLRELFAIASEQRVPVSVVFERLTPQLLAEVVFANRCVMPSVGGTVLTPGADLEIGSLLPMPDDASEFDGARGISLVSEQMQDFIQALRAATLAMKAGRANSPGVEWDAFDRAEPGGVTAHGETFSLQTANRNGALHNLSDLFTAHTDSKTRELLANANPDATRQKIEDAGWTGPAIKLLVNGDSGTGKSLVASLVHDVIWAGSMGAERRPFVQVNCAAIKGSDVTHHMFGSVPGQWSGVNASPGPLARASRGTAFLDEFGDVPPEAQSALLIYLDDLMVQPHGMAPFFSFTHVIAATNRDLDALIRAGQFRGDLRQRFRRRVRIPSLAERGRNEVLNLIDMAAQDPSENPVEPLRGELRRPVLRISGEAIAKLLGHGYSDGNVRELESIVHFALQNARDRGSEVVDVADVELPESTFRPDHLRHTVVVKALPTFDQVVEVDNRAELERLAAWVNRPVMSVDGTDEAGLALDGVLYRTA